ncbi:hypothetical protein ACFYYN_42200 [Streptomyces sp. NPDC001902]
MGSCGNSWSRSWTASDGGLPSPLRAEDGWQERHDAARTAARRIRPAHDQQAILRTVVCQTTGYPASVPDLHNLEFALVVGQLLADGTGDVRAEEFLTAAPKAPHGRPGYEQA